MLRAGYRAYSPLKLGVALGKTPVSGRSGYRGIRPRASTTACAICRVNGGRGTGNRRGSTGTRWVTGARRKMESSWLRSLVVRGSVSLQVVEHLLKQAEVVVGDW